MLALFGILYITGLLTTIMGGLQSLILATGLISPNISAELTDKNFDYQGRFTAIDGNVIDLQEYRGKTLFINLWATWCPPCRAEMPHIDKLFQNTKETENLEFLMIALDEDFEKSKKYIEDKNFTFPVVHATYGLNHSLQSQSIPTTLVVGPNGKILFYQEGMSNFNTAEFRDFLVKSSEKSGE